MAPQVALKTSKPACNTPSGSVCFLFFLNLVHLGFIEPAPSFPAPLPFSAGGPSSSGETPAVNRPGAIIQLPAPAMTTAHHLVNHQENRRDPSARRGYDEAEAEVADVERGSTHRVRVGKGGQRR